jgi:hypothetical protein
LGYRLDDPGFESRQGEEFFLENFQNGCGVLPRLLFCGYCVSFPSRKRLPCRADVKNEWSYTSPLPICLNGVDMDNFAFHFSRITKVVWKDSIWIRLALSLKVRSFLSCGHQLPFLYITLPAKISSNNYGTKDSMCCLFFGSCTQKIMGSGRA